MTDFEMQFRGALWRYLKREGHDVHRIESYSSDFESCVLTHVSFRDSHGETCCVTLFMGIEELMEQL